MTILLWILRIGLAGFFGMAGFTKVSTPVESLATGMPWVSDFPEWSVPVIGALELAAAAGLILPAAFRIAEVLTPMAAAGLVLIMAGAIILHAARGEWAALPMNAVLAIVAGFVAWRDFARLRGGRPVTASAPATAG
ncbi:DoxX-like protein [Stackebrandtia albiflava]|uniref:DoxX-like protein n=1 Tax=Stackebrandtia albiflava TaxID=406432 RepID=A0A562V4Y0_9ACTN|nr:DoxX family protein [Stackebrandtia albiflava]TWJ12946.1 DoxX-like protein [Stackebrandtia albiflava]